MTEQIPEKPRIAQVGLYASGKPEFLDEWTDKDLEGTRYYLEVTDSPDTILPPRGLEQIEREIQTRIEH